MARKTRKEPLMVQEPKFLAQKVFAVGIYCRLSSEANERHESDSLEHQREMCMNYLQDRPDMQLIEVYMDNGRTGTNFDRPDFQRMLSDIQRKRIDCVVAKDLSRFGRNYLDVEEYLNLKFPQWGVRFISVLDRFDTSVPNSDGYLIVPFRNILNDYYARDFSQKIKTVDGGMQDESNSIANQRSLLRSYMKAHPELGRDWEEVVDDGFSGTNFQRPGMQRLIERMKNGTVSLILVKDLSRFGRNYLEAGYFIELVMPMYQVRLIAVNDNYDTAEQQYSAADINLALNNIKNEFYSRDLSRKLRSTLDLRRKNGKFYVHWPYGYIYHPKDKTVSIDLEAACVVKTIFHLAAHEHLGTVRIAKRLNEQGIPSPSIHLAELNHNKRRVSPFWSAQSVNRILSNRVYTGCHELYKMHLIEVGSRRSSVIPMEEREYLSDTHEAIISAEVYEAAQDVICRKPQGKPDRYIRGKPLPPEEMIFPYLRCGCCGNRVVRRHVYEPYYTCKAGIYRVDGYCKDVSCDAVALEPIVFRAIQNLVTMVSEGQEKQRKEQEKREEDIKAVKNSIRALMEKRRLIGNRKMELYERFRGGEMTLQQFKSAKERDAAEETAIGVEIEQQTLRLADLNDRGKAEAEIKLPDCPVGDHLTPELLEVFVSKIFIRENNEPEIIFKCTDIFTVTDK